ncbi:ABC transporter ATP-binding protein [Streptacidiphilus jiangxiensis]|uniref:Putative ABC transport system ATP-binding protein n=1 Tax=Streptacidiphilus jiangxiensis TaxID=235985 RepID=A0A1H7RPQ4_STRJI|nr:ATP-binding cassette domain-containing protein [Streptacidiphilus jiangxiensis]SEL62145.1 putative ABC transport system ATP-binding protein [Streptacidiphilus jiangxiensis]
MSLELRGISVTLGHGDARVTVLDGLDATFAAGTATALVGPSGSGKSTLLAVAGALLRPDAGQVLLDGADLAALSERDRARARRERIGYMFQSGNLLGGLVVVDQLLAAASIAGRSHRQLRPRAEELLTELGLGHRLRHRADQLSGGERQRVALGRALLLEPALLLVDEPTAAVDRTQARALTELIVGTTAGRGCVTVIATHDPAVLAVADSAFDMAPSPPERLSA